MILDLIETLRERLRRGDFKTEAEVRQGIVLRALDELDWPIFNTEVVVPEYNVGGHPLDYALHRPKQQRPDVFLEVTRPDSADLTPPQLLEHAYRKEVPLVVVTNGREWNFYLPDETGHYDEWRVLKLDLLELEPEESAHRLERYLLFDRVCSGEAFAAAREDYQNEARKRSIQSTLPQAWRALLEEPDSLLLELLAEKVRDLCGHKPSMDECSQFVGHLLAQGWATPPPYLPALEHPPTRTARRGRSRRGPGSSARSFIFKGQTYSARTACDAMRQVFALLAQEDPEFLERFAARQELSLGSRKRKRRYLARNKYDLYPGRPDIADRASVEVAPGWWLGTHYNIAYMQKIINLALSAARPDLRESFQINLLG
ncbi:Prophage Lp2 protein 6 [Candidatus Sumerlaea chitinivorans]|uniref:Prophage Lp2 protein 6 n=1 Tax=Sumerlaea chitinivorans TaxID=2250252 RepID=A0A2Z4Y753_SUMC1|nr:Prophage Lp2 protein 6 [Candidatus Sumerlaea chitinivorans]